MENNDHRVKIREMEAGDCEAVVEIWRSMFNSCPVETMTQNCRQMQADSRYHIFVADVDGQIAGFVTTVEALTVNLPNGYIKINGLGVLPEFRHGGIGKMLMEQVESLAAQRGISLIGLASGFQRTDAHGFYENLGYRKLSFWFSKRIEAME